MNAAFRSNKTLQECVGSQPEADRSDDVPEFEAEADVDDQAIKCVKFQFDDLRSDGERFRRATRFLPDEFDDLLDEMSPHLTKLRLAGDFDISPQPPAVYRLPDALQLFLTLLYLRENLTLHFLSIFFPVSDRTLSRYLFRCLRALQLMLGGPLSLPEGDALRALKLRFAHREIQGKTGWVYVVDGTEIPIGKPGSRDLEQSHYSAKKKQHALNVLVITDLDGRILWRSEVCNTLSDQSLWNASNIRSYFERHPDIGIIGDSGFTFNYVDHSRTPIHGLASIKRVRGQAELSRVNQRTNKQIAASRVFVENAFASLKKWRILQGPLRIYCATKQRSISPSMVVDACIFLTNRLLEKKPLRPPHWKPGQMTGSSVLSSVSNFLRNVINGS
jgi:hypothetical protein